MSDSEVFSQLGEITLSQSRERMDGTPAEVFIFSKDDNKKETFARIKFQLGPIKQVGENGTQIEDVLELLKQRLEGFQKGDFRCRTNAIAITKIEEAVMWLELRTKQRVNQGVEGENKKHEEIE